MVVIFCHHLCFQGNGQEEVVCCSWDGQTYIVNHSREVVRYNFNENTAAFAAGNEHSEGGRNSSLVVFGLAVLRNVASRVRSSSGEIFQ